MADKYNIYRNCQYCGGGGDGKIIKKFTDGHQEELDCPACDGTGKLA